MQRIKYLLLLIVFAMVATGCVKFNANMEIKKDKSMEFSIIYAFDKTMLGEENSLKEEQFEDVKKQGFTVTKYTEGNYEGFKMTKKISNIDEVSTTEDVIYDLSGMMQAKDDSKYFKVVKGEDKNTYTAKFKFNANDSGMTTGTDDDDDEEVSSPDETLTTGAAEAKESVTSSSESVTATNEVVEKKEETTTTSEVPTTGTEATSESSVELTNKDGSSNLDISSFTAGMDLSFNVTLPYSAISSNATTKENDNKKLSWKLGTTGQEVMEFTFELKNNDSDGNNLILYIGIGVGVLVVLVLIFLLTRKKGPKEIVPVADDQVEINNTVNESVQEQPVVNQEPQIVNEEEQKDNV